MTGVVGGTLVLGAGGGPPSAKCVHPPFRPRAQRPSMPPRGVPSICGSLTMCNRTRRNVVIGAARAGSLSRSERPIASVSCRSSAPPPPCGTRGVDAVGAVRAASVVITVDCMVEVPAGAVPFCGMPGAEAELAVPGWMARLPCCEVVGRDRLGCAFRPAGAHAPDREAVTLLCGWYRWSGYAFRADGARPSHARRRRRAKESWRTSLALSRWSAWPVCGVWSEVPTVWCKPTTSSMSPSTGEPVS